MFGLYSDLPEAKSGPGKSVEKIDVKQHVWATPRLKPSLKKSTVPAASPQESAHGSRGLGSADSRPVPRDGKTATLFISSSIGMLAQHRVA
jgi:hypothetical protein